MPPQKQIPSHPATLYVVNIEGGSWILKVSINIFLSKDTATAKKFGNGRYFVDCLQFFFALTFNFYPIYIEWEIWRLHIVIANEKLVILCAQNQSEELKWTWLYKNTNDF